MRTPSVVNYSRIATAKINNDDNKFPLEWQAFASKTAGND